jgi:general secretion pathway protein D
LDFVHLKTRRDTLKASAKQWTVVMALSTALGVVTTLASPTGYGQNTALGQNLPAVQDSTQTMVSADAATGRPPVARLLTGGGGLTPADPLQKMAAARKALAAGNVAEARQHLTALAATPAEPGARDSAAAIESMIQRHERLVGLSQSGDPNEYNRQASQFLLEQADQLLAYGDWQTAEDLAEVARGFGNQAGAALTSEMVVRRIANLKQMTPEVLQQRTLDARRMVGEVKLALDRGQLAEANVLLGQLKTLNLPDSAFTGMESRPWQLELELQSKLQSAPARLANAADGLPGQVRTADFQPETDSSRVVLASTEQIPAVNTDQDDAIELYLRGVQALNAGNRQVAQDLLDRAWQKRATLDPVVLAALEQRRAFLRNTIPAMTASAITQPQDGGAPIDLEAQGQIVLQKMRQHIARQRSTADQLREQQQPRQALSVLQSLRADIEKSDLEANSKTQFLSMIDREIGSLNQFISQHIVEIEAAETNIARMGDIVQDRETRYSNEKKIQSLVEQFNQLQREQRYPEASMIARQAVELDPQNPAVILMVEKGKTVDRMRQQEMIRDAKEGGNWMVWNDVDQSSIPMDPNLTMEFPSPRTWSALTEDRRQWLEEQSIGDPTEFRIRRVLNNLKVTPMFQGTPLVQALDMLGQEAGINIAFDARGMADENVDSDTAVYLNLHQPVTMQSALELILSNLNLTYVIENEVIKITGKSSAAPKLQRIQYYVGDLVTPIPNFQGVNPVTIMSAGGIVTSAGMGLSGQMGSNGQLMGAITATDPNAASNSMISPIALAQQLDPNLASYQGSQGPPTVDPLTGKGGMMAADFTSLINLIQSTVEPNSWEENGGPAGATITEFRNTNSLVIRNTQTVHDQIQDLLKRLRELQDVQIVIETRFISLSDSFFERIGVDFDFQLNDYSRLPLGTLDDERSRSAIIGRLGTPDLTIPADFDIPFTQNSFGETVPQFGGFGDPATAANFGFAILSDIEVFFLIQAAKGDQRSNVMTAPKITLFNGQFGTVTDVVTRAFVTSVTPVVGSFAAAHAPVISTLADGTMMSVQAVVSHDRRFVRLTLVPTFTKLNDVEEFTFSGSTTTNSGSGVFDPTDGRFLATNRSTERAGVTVQQPVFAITSVSATVAVPDGGTVLLGGVKRLSEARVERGVPFLSNLPWINRLFKNVGIGRDTSSIMLMVTPRVIIKEEEEARNVGLTP